MIDKKFAFRLSYKVNQIHQDAIIEDAIANGHTTEDRPYWIKRAFRAIEPDSTYGTFSSEEPPTEYFYRMDPRTEWKWIDTPLTETVKDYADMVDHLFTKLTRVKAFIQKPGMTIGPHRDLISGNHYRFIHSSHSAEVGTHTGVFSGSPHIHVYNNTRHADQKYLNFKVPLTSNPGNHGKPFVWSTEKRYLKSEDHMYCINEYEMFHGADSVDFYRGVIFFDGILNMDSLKKENILRFE